MEPTTDHGREIASIVDEKARSMHGKFDSLVIPEVTRALSFLMSRTESQFLVRYVNWRMDHPISGESAATHG
jgi:hypothetical protein